MPTIESLEPEVIPMPGYLDMENPLDGFDWPQFRHDLDRIDMKLARAAKFLVLFKSVQRSDLDERDKQLLETLDTASHQEAQQSEALVKYFAGPVDGMRRALSWCMWSDREAAAAALHGPAHRQAIQLARAGKFYEDYSVQFYEVAADDQEGFIFSSLQTGHSHETRHG